MIETDDGALLKLWTKPRWITRALELHVETLARHGEPWDDDRIKRLVQDSPMLA